MQTHLRTLTPMLMSAALIATALPAAAQDADWSGSYAGADLGVAFNGGDNDPTRSLHVGRDRQYGALLLGGEVEYSQTDIGVPGGVIEEMGRLKLRAGTTIRDTLVYGVVGGAVARGRFGDDYGYVAGVGVSHRLSRKISLGGEFLHHQFSDFADSGRDVGVNTLTARISYHF